MKSYRQIFTTRGRVRTGLCALLLCHAGMVAGATLNQLDDFGDGTTQGWIMGRQSITNLYMANIASGGPGGAGDGYLEVSADNTNVAGGRITFFNQSQWTGDYLGAGITAIAMDVKNFGSTSALDLRLAINGGPNVTTGGLFVTSTSISLPSGSDWTHLVFSLAPGDLVPVSGQSGVTGNDVMATLANITEVRLINSAAPAWNGTPVGALLGIDNISAVPLPPALLLFASGLFGLAAACRGRHRQRIPH